MNMYGIDLEPIKHVPKSVTWGGRGRRQLCSATITRENWTKMSIQLNDFNWHLKIVEIYGSIDDSNFKRLAWSFQRISFFVHIPLSLPFSFLSLLLFLSFSFKFILKFHFPIHSHAHLLTVQQFIGSPSLHLSSFNIDTIELISACVRYSNLIEKN